MKWSLIFSLTELSLNANNIILSDKVKLLIGEIKTQESVKAKAKIQQQLTHFLLCL